ncbi:MAG: hypothetical protein Q9160_002463 [Pyrenula sp. 1 TL-2023]
MGELFAQYAETSSKTKEPTKITKAQPAQTNTLEKSHPLPPIPQHSSSRPNSAAPSPVRNAQSPKRKQAVDESNITSDKENAPVAESIPNPKNPRRTKVAAGGKGQASQSNTIRRGTVLSPKSHNSRTLPRSPVRDSGHSSSKEASCFARPVSPLKPASPLKSAASAATSAITASLHGMVEHAKRGNARTASKEKLKPAGSSASNASKTMPPPPRPQMSDRALSQASNHSNGSNTSAASNVTTVVTKAKTRPGKTMVAAKTSVREKKPTTKTTASKATIKQTTKKVITAEPAAGRRVLRKRN